MGWVERWNPGAPVDEAGNHAGSWVEYVPDSIDTSRSDPNNTGAIESDRDVAMRLLRGAGMQPGSYNNGAGIGYDAIEKLYASDPRFAQYFPDKNAVYQDINNLMGRQRQMDADPGFDFGKVLLGAAAAGIGGLSGGFGLGDFYNSMFSPESGAQLVAEGSMPTQVGGWSTEGGMNLDPNGIWSGNYTAPAETSLSQLAGGGDTLGQISPIGWSPNSLSGGGGLSSLGDWYKYLGPASNLLGGVLGSNAATNAANIQAGATNSAIGAQTAATMAGIDEIRRQSLQARADSMPWLQAGTQAIGTLGNLTGVGGDALNSPLLRKFTVQDFYNDPVTSLSMKFGMDQGVRGIENQQRARGMMNSGAALKELTRYGTDYAGQQAGASRGRFIEDQTNAFNKLAGISGIGQTAAQSITGSGNSAAQGIAGMGQSSGNTTASLLSGLGNARGAASIAGSNAMSNALGSIGNWYTQNRLLDSLGIK